jgi:prefoldin subunit 5
MLYIFIIIFFIFIFLYKNINIFDNFNKIDKVSDQIDKVSDQIDKVSDQIDKVSDQIDKVSDQIDKVNDQYKKILIYYPVRVNITSGGWTVMFYLGQKIKEKYKNVQIYSPIYKEFNEYGLIFNDFTNDTNFDIENTIVIYPEIFTDNPLNAKYVIRWILAEIGINCDKNIYQYWNKNDLVYYYSRETKFIEYLEKVDTIYKQLSIIFVNNIFENKKNIKEGSCFTWRKVHIHKNVENIHPTDSFEIINQSHDELNIIFNKYKYFYCYDPFTFLACISLLCGCVSIIYPLEGVTKKEWLTRSPFYNYLKDHKIDNFYGIAYGLDDLKYAEETIDKAPEFLKNMINEINDTSINSFVNDIKNFDQLKNNVQNNYIPSSITIL